MSLFLPSVQAREGNRVNDDARMYFAKQAAIKMISDGCTLRCDVTLSLSLPLSISRIL